ncbi:MAG: hypothetical protein GC149_01470 [Gammaproteobacteria bacterium]|nr:hypothetical protein [Gammaproteobacteria bacterium]
MTDFKKYLNSIGLGTAILILGVVAFIFFGIDFLKTIANISIGSSIVIVGVVSFFLFRKQWSDLINRIVRAGKGGVEFTPYHQNKVEYHEATLTTGVVKGDLNEEVKLLMINLQLPAVLAEEDKIRNELVRLDLDKNNNEAVNLLTRVLAAQNLAAHFERVYANILGTQLTVLQELNVLNGPATRDILINYFNSLTANFPLYKESGFTFEQWINYLVTANLIRDENQQYIITDMGKEFLRYLTNTNKPMTLQT